MSTTALIAHERAWPTSTLMWRSTGLSPREGPPALLQPARLRQCLHLALLQPARVRQCLHLDTCLPLCDVEQRNLSACQPP